MKDIVPLYGTPGRAIESSRGCYLHDADGKRYIDFCSGVWCANLGHGDEAINEAIESQIRKVIHQGYDFRNDLSESLSRELQDKMGIAGGQSAFLSSGSEAVNLAITLARHLTERKKLLKISSSYLSAYGHGREAPENDLLLRLDLDDYDFLERIDFKKLSCFVLETGGASFDMIFPSGDFVHQIVQKARKGGCLIVADEVTTGMGRTGKWFGFQHYGLVPDIMATGKGLGNGYPVSGITLNSSTAKKFGEKPFRYAQSHQNDPLGCAIGLEVVRQLEKRDLIRRCAETGRYFRDELLSLREKYPDRISDIRARGLMIAVELSSEVDGKTLRERLLDDGFVVGFKNDILRFLPPLTIATSDIDELTEALDTSLRRN